MPTLFNAQGKEIPLPETEPVTEVFVVCERGLPVAASIDEAGVRQALEGRDRKLIRVHRVGLVGA